MEDWVWLTASVKAENVSKIIDSNQLFLGNVDII